MGRVSKENPKGVHYFDLKYLKSITEDLQHEVKKRGEVMGTLETHMATTNLILGQLKEKNDGQDNVLDEHALRIHGVEIKQASCKADSQLKGIWSHIKRLNAYMDMGKSKDDIKTGTIDLHAQQMQHSMDLAISHDSIPLKVAIIKLLPWAILTLIAAIVLTTLVTFQAITGKQLLPDVTKIETSK